MSKRKISFINVLEDYFQIYLPHSRGLSANTIKSYKYCFQLLLQFMREQKNKRAEKLLADKENKVVFGGRLGEYKYYDMDATVASVLERCRKELVKE